MAKYSSVLTIRGTIDDLTFRLTPEGKIVGVKPVRPASRFLKATNLLLPVATPANSKELSRMPPCCDAPYLML